MKASFVIDFNLRNKVFDIFDSKVNRDNYAYFYFELKNKMSEAGLELSTYDINKPSDSIVILKNGMIHHFDLPVKKLNYLLSLESPHVDPQSFLKKNHNNFKKVFTWDDSLIDNRKYFKVNYSFDFPKDIPKKFFDKKLCCSIAGNKSSTHIDELYSKRVEFIRWFEKYHINDFDLFGTKWDEYRFGHGFLGKILNRIKILRKLDHFPSYKGLVHSKFLTMQNYKFAICYENIKDQNGYITEKIFDCFFSGCVPIYWGAKNVTDYIPNSCFIDKRDFENYDEIYNYINSMDEAVYMNYLDSIECFLRSSQADQFRASTFADTIVTEIMKDVNDYC